jgi:hypothetical protein
VGGDDDRVVLAEREKPELLLAVVGFDFPDVIGYFLKKLLGHDGIGIFFKEPHPDRDGLRPIIVKLIEPFGDRLCAVGSSVELDGAKFFTVLQTQLPYLLTRPSQGRAGNCVLPSTDGFAGLQGFPCINASSPLQTASPVRPDLLLQHQIADKSGSTLRAYYGLRLCAIVRA